MKYDADESPCNNNKDDVDGNMDDWYEHDKYCMIICIIHNHNIWLCAKSVTGKELLLPIAAVVSFTNTSGQKNKNISSS